MAEWIWLVIALIASALLPLIIPCIYFIAECIFYLIRKGLKK